jgi:hypothetical protein
VDEAREALLLMDLETARAALSAAEAALGCGEVADPEDLGAFWLVEGALLWFEDDREAATDSLQAAHRVAPDVWYVDFGPELLEFYEEVSSRPVRTGTLALKDVDPAYRTWVDARSMLLPGEVPSGLHLVQLGTVEGVRFGRIVYVVEDRRSAIEPGLPPLERQIAEEGPTAAAAPTRPAGQVDLWLGAGATAWLGRARQTDATGVMREEDAIKWLLPLELGVQAELGRTWGRVHTAAAPVLGTPLLFRTRDDEVRSAAAGWRLAGAGGVTVREGLRVGAAAGATLPSRLDARAVLGVQVRDVPVAAEARVGANLLTDGSVEPALLVVVGVHPTLARLGGAVDVD